MQFIFRFWVPLLLIAFTLAFVAGCTSNVPPLTAGQSATDGHYNYQKITLNGATFLKQPYYDPDPDPGKEWHNWDWIVLNISITNLRPEKSVGLENFDLFDTTADRNSVFTQPTCFVHVPTELTTITNLYEIQPGETKTGNIGCAIPPTVKYPLTLEYDFGFPYGVEKREVAPAIFTIPKPALGNYAAIPKNPKNGYPDSGEAKPR